MLNKKYFTIIIASVAFMVQAQPSLEIVGGTRPTTSSVARIVGKTDPAATATINGVAAKVYAAGHKDAGLTGNFNFSLNMPTEYPNCLLEVLFMSSLPDEEKLCNPAHCKKIAAEVVAGLEEYLLKVKAEK